MRWAVAGSVAIVVFDAVTALAARALNFEYGSAPGVILSTLLNGAYAFLAAYEAAKIRSGVWVGAAVALADATVGWAASWLIGPGAPADPDHHRPDVVVLTAILVVGIGAITGLVAGLAAVVPASRGQVEAVRNSDIRPISSDCGPDRDAPTPRQHRSPRPWKRPSPSPIGTPASRRLPASAGSSATARDGLHMRNRRGEVRDWLRGDAFEAGIRRLANRLPILWHGTVLDGELIAGRFTGTMAALYGSKRHRADLRFVAFDAPILAGVDLRGLPWAKRRERLELLAQAFDVPFERSPVVEPSRALALDMTSGRLEGIVLKDRSAPYRDGSRAGWFKVKDRSWYEREAWRFNRR